MTIIVLTHGEKFLLNLKKSGPIPRSKLSMADRNTADRLVKTGRVNYNNSTNAYVLNTGYYKNENRRIKL